MTSRLRCVVCAYSEVGHACLATLLEQGVDVALVATHADAPGEKRWFASVRELALRSGIPVIEPDDVNSAESLARLRAARPDWLFSFYFRQLLGREALAVAPRGALNLHGSLLPRYRGRAPVNWALIHGERETGVTLHYMDEKPDHGDIVGQRAVEIARDDTAQSLTRKLAAAASALLRELLPALAAGNAPRRAQEHARSSYFGGRRPQDGEIDWREPAERIRDLVRALTDPWPGAFTHFRGRPLMVWWAETGSLPRALPPGSLWLDGDTRPWVACGDGALLLACVGTPGQAPVSGADWARAGALAPGERFDDPPALRAAQPGAARA